MKKNTVKKVLHVSLAGLLVCTTVLASAGGIRSVYAQESADTITEVENAKVDDAEIKDVEADKTAETSEQQIQTEPQEQAINEQVTPAPTNVAPEQQVQAQPEVKQVVKEEQSVNVSPANAEELDYSGLEAAVARYNALSQARKDWIASTYPNQQLRIDMGIKIVNNHSAFENLTQFDLDFTSNVTNDLVDRSIQNVPETPDPSEEKVNVTINYVSSENGTINTLTQEAVKGKPFTVTAPDTFTQSTGPRYFRTSDASQTIASASEGAVITFNYDPIIGILNDVYIDGSTDVTVGESVTYREKSVTQFNYGDPLIEYFDITANRPLVISDPSAAEITAGTVKFLKAGTYTLSGGDSSEDLVVTVSEAGTGTPDPDPVIENTEWFVSGNATAKPGDTNTISINERITYSDGSVIENPNITIPMLYTLTSTDPSDTIVGNSITYGGEGTRTVTFTTMGRAGGFSIVSLTVKVSKGAVTTPPTNPTDPVDPTTPVDPTDPSKPILPPAKTGATPEKTEKVTNSLTGASNEKVNMTIKDSQNTPVSTSKSVKKTAGQLPALNSLANNLAALVGTLFLTVGLFFSKKKKES